MASVSTSFSGKAASSPTLRLNITAKCANAASSVPKWKKRNFGEIKTGKTVENAPQTVTVAAAGAKKLF